MTARSALEANPFYILGVSPRDSRTTIVSAARNRVLTADPQVIEEARSALIVPRSRIDAEVGWLPGVAPARSAALISALSHSAAAFPEVPSGASALAEANLLAGYLERTTAVELGLGLRNAITALSEATERLNPAEVLRAIDEDRAASGFPLIGNVQRVKDPLDKQRRYFLEVACCILDQLPSWEMVDLITDLVHRSTSNGTIPPPRLIEDIVDHYEVRAGKALEMAEGNLQRRIAFLSGQSTARGIDAVPSALNGVIHEARRWDRIAQPVQLSAQARGMEHPLSMRVGWQLRKLAVDLNNDHNLSAEAMTLVRELQALLAELPELAEKLREDEDALHRLIRTRERDAAERHASLRLNLEVGSIRRHRLVMDETGVRFQDRFYGWETITRLRWGGLARPNGTVEFTVAFGHSTQEEVIKLTQLDIYERVTQSLMKGAGERILINSIKHLEKGGTIDGPGFGVVDTGVVFREAGVFNAKEKHVPWGMVRFVDGERIMDGSSDGKPFNPHRISSIHTPNSVILRILIGMGTDRKPIKLSSLAG